jgi:hypothetical protein
MTDQKTPAQSDEPRPIDFVCPECDEPLRGIEGSIAKCPYCDAWLDAPYRDETPAPPEPNA